MTDRRRASHTVTRPAVVLAGTARRRAVPSLGLVCSVTRSIGCRSRIMSALCEQRAAASIPVALTGSECSIWAMAAGGTASGNTGVTVRVDGCGVQPRTFWSTVPGRRWCWLVRTSITIRATAPWINWPRFANDAT